MWMLRPAADVILDAAVKNVAFLLELRIALLERMLSRFVDGVDVYLSVIRDATKQQFGEVRIGLICSQSKPILPLPPPSMYTRDI